MTQSKSVKSSFFLVLLTYLCVLRPGGFIEDQPGFSMPKQPLEPLLSQSLTSSAFIQYEPTPDKQTPLPLMPPIDRVKNKKIQLRTRDGLVRKGILSLTKNALGNIVLCHPAGQNKEFLEPYATTLFPGYNHLRFDFRHHGENGENQCWTIGKKERYEVEAAVKIFKRRRRTRKLPLYGFGISMGAAALLEAESHKHKFDALILQSCFENLSNQVARMYPIFRIPLMHYIAFSSPLTYLARKWSNLDLRRINPTKSIQKVTTPIFLIHSQSDKFIPIKAFHRLKRAGAKTIKKTWTPQGGEHTKLLTILPNEYAQQCQEFLSEIHQKNLSPLELII